jgi:hypothetical protein
MSHYATRKVSADDRLPEVLQLLRFSTRTQRDRFCRWEKAQAVAPEIARGLTRLDAWTQSYHEKSHSMFYFARAVERVPKIPYGHARRRYSLPATFLSQMRHAERYAARVRKDALAQGATILGDEIIMPSALIEQWRADYPGIAPVWAAECSVRSACPSEIPEIYATRLSPVPGRPAQIQLLQFYEPEARAAYCRDGSALAVEPEYAKTLLPVSEPWSEGFGSWAVKVTNVRPPGAGGDPGDRLARCIGEIDGTLTLT